MLRIANEKLRLEQDVTSVTGDSQITDNNEDQGDKTVDDSDLVETNTIRETDYQFQTNCLENLNRITEPDIRMLLSDILKL